MASTKLLNRAISITSQLRPSLAYRATSTASMATAATVILTPDTAGVLHIPTSQIDRDSCSKVSELLQKNHDDYHMYFNVDGFHNHIAHHLLTIFALGASPSQLQKAFDENSSYQRPQFPVNKDTVASMSDPATFAKYLGKEKYFHDYEIFFRKEIERHDGSWQKVLNDYLFIDTPQAKDLLVRMYSGFYHPIIHLGFGIEFEQPAIIIEALAQGATHGSWPSDFVNQTSDLAATRLKNKETAKSLVQLIQDARANKTIRESPHWSDGNKVRDGVLKRALPEINNLCSQWFVHPTKEDIRLKTAEMINACAYFAGAAQHASHKKQIKFDFFYMHCINCSLFYSAFLDDQHDSWLKNEDRARLLQFKGWSDLALYVSRGSPELFIEEIKEYRPKNPHDGWAEIFKRVDDLVDDGHASKLVRAMANGERVCAEFELKEGKDWPIKGEMWLKLGHMAIDSVEGAKSRWARNVGWDRAWENIPDRTEGPNTSGKRTEELKANASLNGIAEGYHETH